MTNLIIMEILRSLIIKISVFLMLIISLTTTGFSQSAPTLESFRDTDHTSDKNLKSSTRINPSTLAMELKIPLGIYPGRGGNNSPINLNYSSKVWTINASGSEKHTLSGGDGTDQNPIRIVYLQKYQPFYSERSKSGWTSTTAPILFNYDGSIFDFTEDSVQYLIKVSRIRVMMPDGSSHELRKDDDIYNCNHNTDDRIKCDESDIGKFLSIDGSGIRLDIGNNSFTLYLPGGSRYEGGVYIDNNGNKTVDYSNPEKSIDTLGREIFNPLPFDIDQVGTKIYNITGINGQNRTYKQKWQKLKPDECTSGYETACSEAGLENPADQLYYIGTDTCQDFWGESDHPLNPSLFSVEPSYTETRFENHEYSYRVFKDTYKFRICGVFLFNPIVLTELELPNGTKYKFLYNQHGEMTKLIYPSGSYERFKYGTVSSSTTQNARPYSTTIRGVVERWASVDGSTESLYWKYESSSVGINTLNTTIFPDSTKTERYLHSGGSDIHGFESPLDGMAFEERYFSKPTNGNDDQSRTMLRRELTEWIVAPPRSGLEEDNYDRRTRDARPTKRISIIFEPGQSFALAKLVETIFDNHSDQEYFAHLNVKLVKEYKYISLDLTTAKTANIGIITALFSNLAPEKITENDFLYDANYKARNITGLLTETRVIDEVGNVKAKKQIMYDEGLYPAIASGNHAQWEDPNTTYLGNPTTIRTWHNIAGNQYVETHSQYDNFGNLRKTWDARGNLTQTDYSSVYGYAYPTSVTTPIPDPSGTHGSTTSFTTTASYDFNTGLPISSTDANGQTTTMEYNDPLLRPTKVIASNGHQTIIEYGAGIDALTRWIKVKSQIDEVKWKEDYTWLDGFSRTVKTESVDPNGDVFVEKEFDNMGRLKKTTNPYKVGETLNWTENFYDDLGRVIKIKAPDSAEVLTDYGFISGGSIVTTSVTVTDQAGKTRRSETDALRRLIKVTEDPGGLNYQTNYSYDVLGNLVKIIQGAQSRWFAYDSLSRLIRVRNPEQDANHNLPPYTDPVTGGSGWSQAYSYDANGNLTVKIDARGVRVGMEYDALNRVKSKMFYDTASSITPPVYYYYDDYSLLPAGTPALSGGATKGKLLGVRHGSTGTDGTYYKYDQVGRIITNHQRTGAANNATTYEYNLSGSVTAETRGNGRKVLPSYDEIGRLNALNTSTSSYTSTQNLLNNISYTSFGALQSETYGNQLVHKIGYNERLQPTEIKLGTIGAEEALLKLGYVYGTANNPNDAQLNTTQNNGNVGRINYYIGGSLQNSQTYQYDQLNRLQSAVEHKNGALNDANKAWNQNFRYDQYGNKQLVILAPAQSVWEERVWFDDSLPQGAALGYDGGDNWNWISSGPSPKSGSTSHISNIADASWSPAPFSGNVSHQSNIAQGGHQHYYWASTEKPIVRAGYKFYAYVYLDPQNVPEEIMLQWADNNGGGWEHRAYWGANKIGLGTDGTAARRYMGPLPPAGQWVRLEVDASAVGMENTVMDAMAFTLYGGRANWDLAGVEGEYTNSYYEQVCEWRESSGGDYFWYCYDVLREDQVYENKVLVDDSVPDGSNVGGDGGDGWNWTGAKTPQLGHQHYFYNASETLQVNGGDKLYTWVYLDPVNIPIEIMLQWCEGGNFEHRAYWGANNIGLGADGTESRRYMGSLPQAGNWVKLEIPASAVGLEGKTLNGMAFTLYGGRAAWDKAGKITLVTHEPVVSVDLNYNSSDNRITTSGYGYDAAGNLIAEPNGKSYTYDGENRIVSATVGGATSEYSYDGNGRRIKKKVGGTTTRFEYGASGELIAEYNDSTGSLIKEYISAGQLSVTVENGTDYKYATSDYLGTPRVWTDQNGNVVSRHDYLPFGEEVFAGTGTRTTAQGYAANTQADGQRKQFTSKERDIETGLDYFLARYYSSTQGRFLSPDEFTGGPDELFDFADTASSNPTFYADLTNPQSLNKYQYTYNNPLSYTDPDGHCPDCKKAYDFTKQVIKDTLLGGAKGVSNELSDSANTINSVLDAGLSTFTDFRIGPAPRFQASTEGEAGAMTGVAIVSMVRGGGRSLVGRADDVADVAKKVENAGDAAGRTGKQGRLRELANDPKVSKADRGWIKQEINQIDRGKRTSIRNPPGKDLAHERGREAAKGYSYKHSNLQDRSLHRTQHKYDDKGRKNKERPLN